MTTSIIGLDARYTVSLEWCGYSEQRYVARFCGDFISSHELAKGAKLACWNVNESRNSSLGNKQNKD